MAKKFQEVYESVIGEAAGSGALKKIADELDNHMSASVDGGGIELSYDDDDNEMKSHRLSVKKLSVTKYAELQKEGATGVAKEIRDALKKFKAFSVKGGVVVTVDEEMYLIKIA